MKNDLQFSQSLYEICKNWEQAPQSDIDAFKVLIRNELQLPAHIDIKMRPVCSSWVCKPGYDIITLQVYNATKTQRLASFAVNEAGYLGREDEQEDVQ